MEISRVIFLLICFALTVGARPTILQNIFPEEIKLGISTEELESIRPEAKKSPVTLVTRPKKFSDKAFELVEKLPTEAGSYIYIFRDSSLQAIIWSEPIHPNLPPSVNPRYIYRELERSLIKSGSQKVARANGTLEYAAIEAELWDYKEDDVKVYFISTSEEVTLIKFNPIGIPGKFFFVSADKIPELQIEADRIRNQIGSIKKTTPALVDRPWKSVSEKTTRRTRRITSDVLSSSNEINFKSSKGKAKSKQTKKMNSQSLSYFVIVLVLILIIVVLFFIFWKKNK